MAGGDLRNGRAGLFGHLALSRRRDHPTKGHFPLRGRRSQTDYLAITNAVPAWTRTRNWTIALLAFKIHFGDRVPDTAS